MIMKIIIVIETMITVNDNNVDEDDSGDDISEFFLTCLIFQKS